MVEQYVAGMPPEMFLADSKTQDAVARRFTIIGDAPGRPQHVAPKLAAAIPDLRPAVGLRNRLTHE